MARRRALRGDGHLVDFVIARLAIDFRRELRLEDDAVLGRAAGSSGLGTSSVTTREEIRTGDELAAEAEAVLVARDRQTDGRGRSPLPSATASSAGPDGLLEHLFSPLALGPVELAEPDRLDRASDDPRARPPADRRLRRLPRGAGTRRCRADRARGDGGAPVRAADLAHARRLPARRSSTATGASRPRCSRTGRGSSSSSCTAGREQIAAPPRPPALAPSPVPSPRFRVGAASARRSRRSRSSSRAMRVAAELAADGRPGRGRDLGRAPLPDRAVPRPGR